DYVANRLASSGASGDPARQEGPQVANLIESREAPAPSKKPLLARKLHDMYALAGRVGELIRPVSEHWHQLRVLTRRYAHLVCIAVLWFSCNNAAKEIVKEEAIYSRERAVNLQIAPYLGSKFIMLTLISAVQTFLFMLVMYGVLEALHFFAGQQMPPPQYMLDYPRQYGVLLLLAMSGVALGLLLSACVTSADRANALLPYVLIPQMILGGGVIAVREGAIYWLAVTLSPGYWAYRGIRRG